MHCFFFTDLKEVSFTRSNSCNGFNSINISDIGIRYGFGFKELKTLKMAFGYDVSDYFIRENTVGHYGISKKYTRNGGRRFIAHLS